MSDAKFFNKPITPDLQEEVKLFDAYMKVMEIVKEIYSKFLKLGFGYSNKQIEYLKNNLLEQGFPIKIETKFGRLEGKFNANLPIVMGYAEILGRVALSKSGKEFPEEGFSKFIDEKDKEFAQLATTLYLMIFIPKLKNELSGMMSDVFELTLVEIARLLSKSQEGQRERIEQITKLTEKRRKAASGIKRGGSPAKKGFWDVEKKKQFCKKVDELPKVKGEKAWKYIFDELSFVEFDLETQVWLKKRPELQIIPDFLFDEAVKKWRKYNSVREIKENKEKPRYFEYRLALYLLEYPDEFEFSTLDTYYKDGKTLLKNRDFQS